MHIHTICRHLLCFAVLGHLSASAALTTVDTNTSKPSVTLSTTDPTSDYIGKRLMSDLRQAHALLTDPISQSYIQQFGEHLSQSNPQQPESLQFALIHNNSINAFAAPGGHVVVFSGLITAAKTPSELASVLAHEIAHLSQRHLDRMMDAQHAQMVPVALGIIAAIAAGAAGRPDLIEGAILSGQSLSVSQQLHQNRAYEFEADRIAMQTMQRAQLDPKGLPDFLARMQRQTMSFGSETGYMRTHPLLNNRIADANNRSYPEKSVDPHTTWSFLLIQTRINIDTNQAPIILKPSYQKQMQHDQGQAKALATYGLALLELQNHEFDAAKTHLQWLTQHYPQEGLFHYDLASAATQQHHYQQALAQLHLAKQKGLFPAPIYLAMAENYQGLQQWPQAIHYFRLALNTDDQNPEAYIQLAMTQAALHHYTDAYLSRAKAFAIDLDLDAAITQVEQAQKQPGLSAHAKKNLDLALQHYHQLRQHYQKIETG